MAQKIKSMKQKLANGTYSDPIPFGANGENIDMKNGYNLENTLGEINVQTEGTIKTQLSNRYTKSEVDELLASMVSWESVDTWEEEVVE